MTAATVRLCGVRKTYGRAGARIDALRGVDLDLHAGEMVALMGPSGSGKSTLLLVLGGWERPDAGDIELFVDGQACQPQDAPWGRLGVVPQGLGLLDDLTVRENVALPGRLASDAIAHTDDLLRRLDVDALADRLPDETSLGQQQRVAVARALALNPTLVLADEPTTHQDSAHVDAIFAVLRKVADSGAIVVVATHDLAGTQHADSIVTMSDGQIVRVEQN
jgi:putative ABC transport system ATP-binding protein